jgi:hypothetical protein
MRPTTRIQPYQHVTTQQVCGFSIHIHQVILFESCTVAVNTYDINNNLVNVQMLEISGDDYKAWSTDDAYITNYVATKLGFDIAPISEDPISTNTIVPADTHTPALIPFDPVTN